MATIATFIGALLPTLALSRFFLWLMRRWDGGVTRLLTAHGVSLLTATLLGGMGMADEGAFVPLTAAGIYLIPQTVWLVVDLARHNRRRHGDNQPTNSN